MKSNEISSPPRQYRMKARAQAAEETAQRILQATLKLFMERAYDQVTLQEIAALAGVTRQTVLRRFGSKEKLITSLMESDTFDIRRKRESVTPGDLDAALEVVLAQYEAFGDVIIRNLSLEERYPDVRFMIDYGRKAHRDWSARTFAPYLPPPETPSYLPHLALFITATDVYTWKILRRDQGLDLDQTQLALHTLLTRLTASNQLNNNTNPERTQ